MMSLDILTRPFPLAEVKQRKNEAGKTFDYVEAHSVISRLNEAFQGAWSFRVVQHQMVEHEVIVLGELSGDGLVKQQFGSAVFRPEGPDAMTVGDTFKAAASDALKKCATEFGVALELYGGLSVAYPEPSSAAGDGRVADMPAPVSDPATEKQRAFLEKIAQRDDISAEDRLRVRTALAGSLSKAEASELISNFSRKRAA
jgi:hypothetical protein